VEYGHDKILIFAHHRDVIEALTVGLKDFGAKNIMGGTPMDERQKIIDEFQNDFGIKTLILSIEAAGVGITLTAASYVIFAEFSYVPGVNEQAVDRTHRIGQTRGVITEYLTHEKSLDERILKKLLDKKKIIEDILS
jgi:SWI/SNF-related matrix-associated actin-dependent regulator 1 of chromatin subfamily A